MSEFRRTRSKVWWSNYFHEEDDTDELVSCTSSNSVPRFSWRRSRNAENGNRNSSSSPGSGSHKSQDSGFSDSESSSPSSCSLKEPKNSDDPIKRVPENGAKSVDAVSSSTEITFISKLPKTTVDNGSGLNSTSHKIKDTKTLENERCSELKRSKCHSISDYLADCYFPVISFGYGDDIPGMPSPLSMDKLPLPCKSQSLHSIDQVRSPAVLNNSKKTRSERSCRSHNCNETDSRTCFIVDELPKKNFSESARKFDKVLGNSIETVSTSSDEGKDENTVRYVEKEELAEIENRRGSDAEVSRISTPENLEANESRLSNFDLTRLPEPTHTSTPKNDETKRLVRLNKKRNKKLDKMLQVMENERNM